MTITSINPHDPSDVVLETQSAGPDGVDTAVARARGAAYEWRALPAAQRGDALRRIGDDLEGAAGELVGLVVREVGKPVAEARQEVGRAVSIFRYYSQLVLTQRGEDYPQRAARPGCWRAAARSECARC